MKRALSLAILLAVAGTASAITPSTPTIDGSLADWAADEIIFVDSSSDTAWGGNELESLHLTWDATNLYIAITGTLGGGNTYDIWIGAGDGSTCTDATGITWGKRIQFSGWNPDYVLHFAGGFGTMFQIASNGSATENATGTSYSESAGELEWSVPWSKIGLQANQVLRVAATITGGGWDGCDAMPSQTAEPNGDGTADVLDQYLQITVADGSSVPLSAVAPNSAVVTLPVELDLFQID